ncbi:hypothetical protein PIB30_042190 [Stylosanthes scabra]|uniref:Uncharacterized protein n=1 Tax=Stylosanthes scabra TaxID=79078 RepID=A0ABU6TG47_9FABA|nr:hypothetical protein [Stylosanthes scabra]
MTNHNRRLLNPNPNPERVLSIPVKKSYPVELYRPLRSQIGASCGTTALGRHLAIDTFKDAAKFFLKLWKVYAKDVSATFDLTLVVAQTLYRLFSAQALELKLQQHLDRTYIVSALQEHRCALLFKSVSKHYRRVLDLLLCDSAVSKYVVNFHAGLITHLHQKRKFFRVQARQRRSSILPKSKRPKTFKVLQLSPLEKLLRGICMCTNKWIPKQHLSFLELTLSEHSPFRIIDGGKLVAMQWDMPLPYPKNLSILSSSSPSSHMLAIPLKKSEHIDLYNSLRNYFVLKYSESAEKSVEGFLKILDKLRREMQRDDLSLHMRVVTASSIISNTFV